MTKATMQDVAQESGVSLATVSRAIRNPELVSNDTRERVETAIQKTNYKYTMLTPAPGGVMPVIGVLVPTSICFGFADTIMGIQEASQEKGFALTVGYTNYDSKKEKNLLEQFKKNRISGLILTGFTLSNEPLIRDIVQSGVPACVIWEKSFDADISYVGIDNFKAVYDLATHLISLGHKRIGMLCGPFSKSERPYRRLNGYREALEENGIAYDSSLVLEGNPSMEEGKIGMEKIMSLPEPPSAVLAAADVLALGALLSARNMGLSVPKDVSIVGMDDIAYAKFSIPPLTTARVPAFEMGYKAVEVVARNVSEKEPKIIHKCLDVPIVERESTREFNA